MNKTVLKINHHHLWICKKRSINRLILSLGPHRLVDKAMCGAPRESAPPRRLFSFITGDARPFLADNGSSDKITYLPFQTISISLISEIKKLSYGMYVIPSLNLRDSSEVWQPV